MASLVAGFPALIASRTAALKSVMLDQYRKAAPVAKNLFNVRSTDQYNIEERSFAGFGLLQKIQNEAPANWPVADIAARYNKTITTAWWGLRTQMTKPFIKFDRDGFKAAQQGRLLVDAARNTQEFYATDLLYNHTSTGTGYVLPDSAALASNSHPLLDNVLGGTATFDNYVGGALDTDNLALALTMAMTQVNDRGIPLGEPGQWKLLHAPQLWEVVGQLLNSQYNNGPGHFDAGDQPVNMLNASRSQLTPVSIPFMGQFSSTWWALQGPNHRLDWYDTQGIETDVWRDNNDKQINADIDFMAMWGTFDWRDYVGGNV